MLSAAECDMNIYQPVCDRANQETYQNPCLLGCKKILKGEYADCLCLLNNSTVSVGESQRSIASLETHRCVPQVDARNANVRSI